MASTSDSTPPPPTAANPSSPGTSLSPSSAYFTPCDPLSPVTFSPSPTAANPLPPPPSPDEHWFDASSCPHVPARLVTMSTAERAYWGGLAVLMWLLSWVVLVWAPAEQCSVCRVVRTVKFFDDDLHRVVFFAATFAIYVGLVALLVCRFGGYGCRVTDQGKLYLQVLFAVVSCYTSMLFKDEFSALVACSACLWLIPICNLFLVVYDFGMLEGGLSVVNYAIISGFGSSVVGWSLVVVAVTMVLSIKYRLHVWLQG